MDGDKILRISSMAAILVVVIALSCSRTVPKFDSSQAFSYLEKQCDFGARVPNSEAHEQCADYLYNELAKSAEVCRYQKFTYYDSVRSDTLHLTNIIASFNKNDTRRILLCAHWDSRPWADKDPDSSLHNNPVMGANDGASGVAILLTIAKIFRKHPPAMGVDIILFDGEDYGEYETQDGWLLGSKYFASHIGNYHPSYVVLLDMVGDSSLDIHKDYYSNAYAGWLVNKVWKAAEAENASHFYPDIKHTVYDDHIPFLELGIPAVDIIDMDYDWWHTIQDTPDKCSPESLGEVGRVVLRLIYDKQFR